MRNVIGVCTTKINDEFSRNYINILHSKALKDGLSVAVFHSVYDFSDVDVENGGKAIFSMLPFERLCALIILHDAIFDVSLLDLIINDAKKAGVPVIFARGNDERCYSLEGDYDKAYEKLLRSVIEKQNVTDTLFLAGRKTNDPDSEKRIQIYKKVLADCNIDFDENNIDYGGYWETPTFEALGRLFSSGRKIPRAIFCANDIMAFAVIEKLTQNGYKIPEDVIVTGFDGLEYSGFCVPALSTCAENTNELVELTIESIRNIINGKDVPRTQKYGFRTIIRQSSVLNNNISDEQISDTKIFYRMRLDEINERNYNIWLDKIILVPNSDNLRRNLPEMVSADGYSIAIRTNAFFCSENNDGTKIPKEFLLISKDANGKISEMLINGKDLIEKLIDETPNDRAGFYSMISKNDFIYGLAYSSSDDIFSESAKMNRFVQTLNRALFIGICGEKQRKDVGERFKKKYIDQLTGMNNIDGANKWFSDVVSVNYTRSELLSVGVYTFINYQQNLERYGLQAIEEQMQYISRSLKLANPEDSVIARISADSFAVMILRDSSLINSGLIDTAISIFYGFIDTINKSNTENGMIEISCGYTESTTPWLSKLSDFLNAAISNLYLNRVLFEKNMPKNIDLQNSTKLLEYRALFITLINKNLFKYHFQPIVSAKNGEIIAYEALMRTDESINMSPLEVISTAEMYRKLNELELASFKNIFRRFYDEQEKFKDRKVFINTIPGHFLTKDSCLEIFKDYKDVISRIVIEITESETITVEELENIRTFGGNIAETKIAVDDYGTGHSNIVNLLEYKPHIVKIDRYLITNIQNDKNKQMFVKNLIDFGRDNNILILAEGVETLEEMNTVIDFGVDLIQGYYTARPTYEIIDEIPAEIREQIIMRADTGK